MYLPFLIIDMVVASVLMSMGMMMMSPVMVALPFKIMLFVLVDGWNLLIASLVNSFGGPATMTPTSVVELGRRALEVTFAGLGAAFHRRAGHDPAW